MTGGMRAASFALLVGGSASMKGQEKYIVDIGADYVKEIYPHAVVVSDFQQMSKELLHILGWEFQFERLFA
jgi:hypothetical protein